jgi:hypothetical protein
LYLRELAKRANPAYQQKLRAIIEEFPEAFYHEGPLKGEPRMLAKGREDYAPEALKCYGENDLGVGGVVDIARLSVCCENADVMCKVVQRLTKTTFEQDGLEVLRQKNGFHPDAESSGGYRDFKLTMLVGVPGMEREGVRHVVECQLLLQPYLEVKKFQHVLYEVERGDCFDVHGRLGVGIFRALESRHDAEGLMTLVTAVDSSYRKTYAQYKRETDAKIAAEAANARDAHTHMMELLEMQKQKEKLEPLQVEQEDVQLATEVFVHACLKAHGTLPPFEYDDWLSHVQTEAALAEIEAVVSERSEPWQEDKENIPFARTRAREEASNLNQSFSLGWRPSLGDTSALGTSTTMRRKRPVMKM